MKCVIFKLSPLNYCLQVSAWLEQLFAGQNVPQYEINSRTLDILLQLAERNKRQDRDAELVTQDLHQKTEEYAAEGKFISHKGWTIGKMITVYTRVQVEFFGRENGLKKSTSTYIRENMRHTYRITKKCQNSLQQAKLRS